MAQMPGIFQMPLRIALSTTVHQMKSIIAIALLFGTQLLHAQPGRSDFQERQLKRFNIITDSLAKDPGNPKLTWERTELLFRPQVTIYERSLQKIPGDSTVQTLAFQDYRAFQFRGVDVREELAVLINAGDIQFASPYRTDNQVRYINKANCYLKRGLYHYLKNEWQKAIDDYQLALQSNPDELTKKEIHHAIATYYFNLGVKGRFVNLESQTKANLLQALEHIDQVAPQFDKGIQPLTSQYLTRQHDYENEKLDILHIIGDRQRLENYHLNKTQSLINLYNALIDDQRMNNRDNKDHIYYALKQAIASFSECEFYLAPRKIEFKIGELPQPK